jgi:hypothetical protein
MAQSHCGGKVLCGGAVEPAGTAAFGDMFGVREEFGSYAGAFRLPAFISLSQPAVTIAATARIKRQVFIMFHHQPTPD